MARKRKNKMPVPITIALLIVIAAGYYFGADYQKEFQSKPVSGTPQGQVLVYYLDVGQGDSELIRLPGGVDILIDAGTRGTADGLVEWLQEKQVEKIDYLIATHPHEDHIGGMAKVVSNFEIGKIYAPRVADDQIPTTKTYESFLDAISNKELKMTAAKAGMTVLDENGVRLEFLGPVKDRYEGLNSYSVVTKLTFGTNTFLFTGDAESDSEQDMLEAGKDVKSDVLKCGHHGSSTSTSVAFLKAVNPTAAIISCAKDNDYGHPHKEIVKRLGAAGVDIYRTDEMGTIVAAGNGSSISFTTGEKSVR